MNEAAVLTKGVPDAAVQRALRALELALNEAIKTINTLTAQLAALEARVTALEP